MTHRRACVVRYITCTALLLCCGVLQAEERDHPISVQMQGIVGDSGDIDYATHMTAKGTIGKAAGPYKMELNQRLDAKNGNWLLDTKRNCKIAPDLKLDGALTFTLHTNGKSTKTTLKITGQKTSSGIVYLKTDAGLDVPLGEECVINLTYGALQKLSSPELKTLADDALAKPTAEKIYRLAQFKAQL